MRTCLVFRGGGGMELKLFALYSIDMIWRDYPRDTHGVMQRYYIMSDSHPDLSRLSDNATSPVT